MSDQAAPPPADEPSPAGPGTRRALFALAALAAAAATVRGLAAGGSDDVSAEEAKQRAAALNANAPLPVRRLAPEDVSASVRRLGLGPHDEAALLELARRGTPFIELELYDSDAEDGDVAGVESLGLNVTVPLRKAPVLVPVPLSVDHRVRIAGIDEGRGGGVTVGIVAGGKPLAMPPLKPGQTITLPLAAP